MQGTVKFFNGSKGFGYITPSDGSEDVNVRSGDIQRDGGYKALSEGQRVEFEVSEGPRVRKPRTSGWWSSRAQCLTCSMRDPVFDL